MANLLFDRLIGDDPDERTCIEQRDGAIISYAQLNAITARAAGVLQDLGVEPGDRVAVQVDKSVSALVLYLATLRAGAVFLPLNTAYTGAEIEYFISDAEPALFVCRPQTTAELRPTVERAGARLLTLDNEGCGGTWPELVAQAHDRSFAPVARDKDDLAGILYTSGTTGRSKGAMLTHGNLTANAATLIEYWGFTPADTLLHALPIFHTHGLFVAVNVALMARASMIFLPRFDACEIISLMPRATVLMGVPTFYTRLLNEDTLDREAANNMRLFISGSAPLRAQIHEAFRERTGHTILERYGMTETGMNTSNPCDGERRAGTVGHPLPDVALRVTDPQSGRVLGPGQVGMLEVRGPNVFPGYWGMPEKTREEFRDDGYFITGDLGLLDEDGYVTIVGRDKDLVISGGYNVYPKEIEKEIDAVAGVAESAVIGVPHADFGEAVVAVVVCEPDADIDPAGIQAQIAPRLARYKQPKQILFAPELPRNAMGKVQKNELRRTHDDLFGAGAARPG